MNIVENAVATPAVSTLVAAVQAWNLVETLSSEWNFTVFAPTNTAFDNLPAGTLDSLLKDENIWQLQSILTYHVLPNKLEAWDLKDGQVLSTVQWEDLYVSIRWGKVFINGANVQIADVQSSNGVIHVIDGVILPLSLLDEQQKFKIKAESMLAWKFSKLSLEKQLEVLNMLDSYSDKINESIKNQWDKMKLLEKVTILKNIMLSVQ
jgi:hypothetical protein